MGTAAALEGSTAHWNAIALRCCGRALHSGSSHGCWVESNWFLGYSYVSKALAGIILDILAKVRRREPQNQTGFSLFVIAIVSEAQSKAT